MGGILAPIDQSLVGYTPGVPGFEALVSSTLGDTASAADGFDSDLAYVLAQVPGTDVDLAAADSVLEDLYNGYASFNALDLTDLVDNWNGVSPVLSAFAGNLELQTIGVLQLPKPPAPPVPPPPAQPPTECFPKPAQPAPPSGEPPAPPEPPPVHRPIPPVLVIPSHPPDPCPAGFAPTASGGCASATPTPPPPAPPPPGPPVPPILIIPPGPPVQCPDGFISDGAGGCISVGPTGPGTLPGSGPYFPIDPTCLWDPGCGGISPPAPVLIDPWDAGGPYQYVLPW